MSLNAFENLIGRRFGINVEVTGLQGRKPLRWQCFCHKCQSSYVEQHQRLVDAGGSYRCRNVSCALNRVEPRPLVPPTEKPAPVPVPVAAPTGPKPSPEYTRYVRAMRDIWKHPESSIASWSDFKMLEGNNLKRIMAPVEAAERQREGEQQARALELQWQNEFDQKHGIERR
jgi:hypothetical protein